MENQQQEQIQENESEFSAELFNLSKEYEDIEYVLSELNDITEMAVVARRC